MPTPMNTFSIVAWCERTGQLGVAVATAVPAVGSICPYAVAGLGAVSTQSWVNPYLATRVLDHLRDGLSAEQALGRALADDPAAHARQIGVVDAAGRSAAWTGEDCTPWCGHVVQPMMAVQGNMLVDGRTVAAMAEAFCAGADESLAERLMRALEAGDEAGGDKRGKQSAALRVHAIEDYPLLDLRVDEHAAPVQELRRVLSIALLQLVPFVEGMPRKGDVPAPAPRHVSEMLLQPPPERPGGGGSGPLPHRHED
jgi:uncharacterized Ntn-hydrolase superfamily protein